MAFTYTTLKQAIQDYCESNETSFVSNMPTIIQQAEDKILKSIQIPDFIKNVSGTVASGNPYLIMPADFLTPYSMAIDNSGYEYLLFKDVNFIRQAYPSSSTQGAPKYYGLFSSQYFIVGPSPDANYDVELHYFHAPESITESASGTSWLGDNAASTLLYGSLVEAYTYLKGDPDLMQLYTQRYQEALDKLGNLGEGYSTTDNYRSGAVRQQRS